MDEKREKLVNLGQYIKLKRIVKGLSISFIEKEYKIDKATWSKIEGGKLNSLPKPELLMHISEILEINCIELYIILGYLKESEIINYLYAGHRGKEMGNRQAKP